MLVTWANSAANAPGRIGSAISDMMVKMAQPKITIHEMVLSTLQEVRKTNKLVVAEPILNVDVTREESYSSWGLYWGTNVARVLAQGVRTQFFVDMSQLSPSDFSFDEQNKILTVHVPQPRLDTQMVAIDPANIMTMDLRGGWSRFDKYDTRDHAIAALMPKTLAEANSPLTQRVADDAGIEALTRVFQPLANEIAHEGITVRVAYGVE